jgi:hypothetical protein
MVVMVVIAPAFPRIGGVGGVGGVGGATVDGGVPQFPVPSSEFPVRRLATCHLSLRLVVIAPAFPRIGGMGGVGGIGGATV